MLTTTEYATADADTRTAPDRNELAEKILSMTAEELELFIYLAEKELGLRFD